MNLEVLGPIQSLKEIDGTGSDSYVVRGAKTRCSLGTSSSHLDLKTCHGVYLHDKPQMNVMDFIPEANIQPFGTCLVSKAPCTPAITGPWQQGKNNVLIEGQPALLNTSTNFCTMGGIITITNNGQGT